MKKAATAGEAKTQTVEEYLASVPEPARDTLKKVRAIIQETANRVVAPAKVTEVISYRIPAVKIEAAKYKGIVMWYAAFSDHCSLFPTASVIQAFEKELKDYRVSKGTVQFSISSAGVSSSSVSRSGVSSSAQHKPLPAALLKKMVKARLAELEGKKMEGKKTEGKKMAGKKRRG